MERFAFHLFLHIFVPALVAKIAYKERFYWAWGMMMVTMLVDLDHLFANPVFDSARCSIGHHFLHSYTAISIYIVLIVISKCRVYGVGLTIHMLLDGLDCILMEN